MLSRYFAILLMVFTVAQNANAKPLADVKQLKWQNRVLILWAQDVDNTYTDVIAEHKAALNDRDLIVFVLDETNLHTNFEGELKDGFGASLRKRYPQEKANYFLLGKDGGLKRYGQEFNAPETFAVIDSMPMRMRELDSEQY
ncbi:MAG: DUF4174 domain-containing protein [Pseudomonadota bacterium]